jgi:hypothetical protein
MMRIHGMATLLLIAASSLAASVPVQAQAHASPAAPATPSAASNPPAASATPATPATEATTKKNAPHAAAPAAAPAASQPEPTNQAAAASAAVPSIFPSEEAQREGRERWRLMVTRERMQRARQTRSASDDSRALEAERVQSRRYGDAGAPIAIGVSWDRPWYTGPSYDLFSDKDVASRFGLWGAYDVASLRTDLIAALELGWGREHAKDDGLLGGSLGSELTTDSFYGGAQLRWVPASWLQPHARLAGGAALVNMALRASSTEFKDRGLAPFASLGLGCTFRTPSRLFEDTQGHLAPLSLGLMLEGGYTLAAPLDFTADGPGPGARAIALTDAKLGRFERSGPYARASFVVRF